MKKFLPRSANNPQGFTLIELLVVVAIIAILSVIGIAVFGQVQARARDARRRADIDAISKAYEVTYDPAQTSPYRVLTGTDFQSGTVPNPPEGGNYTGLLASASTTYNVCATLEGGIATCSTTSEKCYCRSAAQSGTTATGITPACPAAITITSGSSCQATTEPVGTIVGGEVYFCPTQSFDCSNPSNQVTEFYRGPYYKQVSGGTAEQTTGANPVTIIIKIWRNGAGGVGQLYQVNAKKRSTNP